MEKKQIVFFDKNNNIEAIINGDVVYKYDIIRTCKEGGYVKFIEEGLVTEVLTEYSLHKLS